MRKFKLAVYPLSLVAAEWVTTAWAQRYLRTKSKHSQILCERA